jgi:hypothetical protein
MSEYATNGAMLECNCGTIPTPLQVTSQTLVSVQGQNVATISDKSAMTNIKPFGQCKLKPTISGYAPCVPVPTVWAGFVNLVQIPGGNPLLKRSTIPCGGGGIIKFKDSGQKRSAKVVVNPSSPQIVALRKAAILGIAFCEECEKKKPEVDEAVKKKTAQKQTGLVLGISSQREKKKALKKILRIYWIDEYNEPHELSELQTGQYVTMCIDVEDGAEGETLDVSIEAPIGKRFKGGGIIKNYSGILIDADNTAYIDNFSLEYDK